LQNQLYLQLRHPNGVVEDGDVTAFPTVTNNVQQVTLDVPAAGTYEIRVRGVSVTQQAPGATGGPSPRQDFALVVSNAENLSA
jgi:serine protease AprX